MQKRKLFDNKNTHKEVPPSRATGLHHGRHPDPISNQPSARPARFGEGEPRRLQLSVPAGERCLGSGSVMDDMWRGKRPQVSGDTSGRGQGWVPETGANMEVLHS